MVRTMNDWETSFVLVCLYFENPCQLAGVVPGASCLPTVQRRGHSAPCYARTRSAEPVTLMTMGDVICEELEDLVHFSVHDLPGRGYAVMEEIRRQGKLCDVTLKVTTDRRTSRT